MAGSLASNSRLQRVRLVAGWNLVSLAVDGAALAPHPEIAAAYQWNPITDSWQPVETNTRLASGSVLWVRALTNAHLAFTGTYRTPTNQAVLPGGGFVSNVGLSAWPLISELNSASNQVVTEAWHFDGESQRWLNDLLSLSSRDAGFPDYLAPGHAIFVQASAASEWEGPDPAQEIRYYHQDHLGSSSVITDAAGQLIEETAYYPFGIPRFEYRLRSAEESYQFTQKERDEESGLHYFEARHLASRLSRFASVDPKYLNPDMLSGADLGSFLAAPQNLNLYSYVAGNPLNYQDPTGLEPLKSPGLLDIADKTNDQLGLISDATKLKGPGTLFDLIGVGIKTAKFAEKPSVERGIQLGYEIGKTTLTKYAPPLGLALQLLDVAGIGPGTFFDWATDELEDAEERIQQKKELAATYKKTAETYERLARGYQNDIVRIQAETRQIQQETREKERAIERIDERLRISRELLKKARARIR